MGKLKVADEGVTILNLPDDDELVWRTILPKPDKELFIDMANNLVRRIRERTSDKKDTVHSKQFLKETISRFDSTFESENSRYEKYKHVKLGYVRVGPELVGEWRESLARLDIQYKQELQEIRDSNKDNPSHPSHQDDFISAAHTQRVITNASDILRNSLRGWKNITVGDIPVENDEEGIEKIIRVICNLGIGVSCMNTAISIQTPNTKEIFV